MKKLLFLLLLPIFCFAQVSNGTETEFEAIKTTSSQEITSPVYLGTEGVDGTHGKIPSAYIEKTVDKLTAPTYDGTGVKYYNADVINTAFKRNASIFGHTGISSKTDQFELTVLDANTVRIKPVDFAFFLEEIYPSISIVNDGIRAFSQKDYALSQLITATSGNINLNPLTTDGLYVRYLGYDVDGNVVSSAVDFSKNDAIAQLGFVTVVKTGGAVAFLSTTPGARNVFSQPLLADMNDLQRSRVKVSSDVRVSLNAAASIATSAGLMYGASINWRGVSNVGNTSPIDEYSVTAQSTAAFNSIDPSFSTLTASPTVHTLWTELEGGIAINNSFWNTTTSARGTMANGTASVKRILIGVRGGIFVQEGQHTSTACYANLSEAINNIFNAQFDDAIVPPSVAVEIARIAYIKGTTNLLTQGYLQITGGGTGSGSTVAPVSDATTVSKGILQLAGDLGGTAASPTTPTAVHITGNETVDGTKSLKQRLYFNRSLDNTPTASLGFEDTGFNFSIDAGGGGSYLTFKNSGSEVGRFSPTSGQLLIGTTTEEVDASYKLIVNGKGRFFNNVYSANFSDLLGKHWVIFGDSFSNDFPTDYVGVVKDNLGLTANTYAASGASSSDQLTELKGQITANPTFLSTYDIISLHIGVNDYANGSISLGSIESTIGSGSVSANIKEFIEVALTNNPLIKVFIITPPEANGGTSGLTYKTNNASGWNLETLSTTISTICKYYSVQCVDLYSLSQFNLKTIPTLTGDGLHPNTSGKNWLGNIVSRAFVSNNSAGVATVTNQTSQNFIPKSETASVFKNSQIFDNGVSIVAGTGVASPTSKFYISYDAGNFGGLVLNSNVSGAGSGGIQFHENTSPKWHLTTQANNDFSLYNQSGAATGFNFVISKATGAVTITNLAGTGTRQVVADASGNLSTIGTAQPLKYVALLSQTGTSAPTATVLENTLGGTVVWTRNTTGLYEGTLTGVFTTNKTAFLQGGYYNSGNGSVRTYRASNNIVQVMVSSAGTPTDGLLDNYTLEIRVYP